jgi:hypothetical protein
MWLSPNESSDSMTRRPFSAERNHLLDQEPIHEINRLDRDHDRLGGLAVTAWTA